MPQLLNLTTIKKWIKDYRRHKQLPNETNCVTIDLVKIKEFIAYIDEQNEINAKQANNQQINAVRFYLTRQNNISEKNVVNGNIDDNITDTNSLLEVQERRMTVFFDDNFEPQTQISLLALPVLNYKIEVRPDNKYTNCLNKFRQHTTNEEGWWVGKDYRPNESEVHCLYARNALSEHSGMCPYNCDGVENGD